MSSPTLGTEFTGTAFRRAVARLGGLDGATPLEALLGTKPAHLDAVEPPRGLPGAPSEHPPFEVVFLDPAPRRLPVLARAA